MSEYNEELEAAQLLKRAKRDMETAKDLKEAGDVAGAIKVLSGTLEAFDASPLVATMEAATVPTESMRGIAAKLADIIGMLGGNHRRLGQLEQAQQLFARGSLLEASPLYGVMSSYNLVNAITLPIEIDVHALATQSEPLERAVVALDRQVSSARRNDRWAWADLAQCQLLLGRMDDALQSYARVRSLGDDDTFVSIVSVLERLAKAAPTLQSRVAAVKRVLGSSGAGS